MNKTIINTFTTEEIHKLRVSIAEQYRNMPPDAAYNDFKFHVQNAKNTMVALRKEKQIEK